MTKDWYSNCPNDLWDEFSEDLTDNKPGTVYYGGYPDFTQDDFHRVGTKPDYSVVLLQLGFHHGVEPGIEICWGDAGEACFLITKEDLAVRRFDRVAYNWDCS